MNTYKIYYSYLTQRHRRYACKLETHETAYKAVKEFRKYWGGCKGFRIERVLIERSRTWEEVEVDE